MKNLISVVIPYYQTQPGILTRALQSVDNQDLPDGWRVEIIIVGDGSPLPADTALEGYSSPVHTLRIIAQPNGGVSSARNTGLDAVSPASQLTAFLDSDDIWPCDHLAKAITAMNTGTDFYFSDNARPGFHASNLERCTDTTLYIKAAPASHDLVDIPTDKMIGFVIKEFPCQASTVVYRSDIAKDIRFDITLKSAGEDVLFFSELASVARKISHDRTSKIICGDGENIYFGNFDWNSPKLLNIKMNHVLVHRKLKHARFIKDQNRDLNNERLKASYLDFSFHLMRSALRSPARATKLLVQLIKTDIRATGRVAMSMPTALLRQITGAPNQA